MNPLPLYLRCIRRAYCLTLGGALLLLLFVPAVTLLIMGARSDYPGRKSPSARSLVFGNGHKFCPRETNITQSYDTLARPDHIPIRESFKMGSRLRPVRDYFTSRTFCTSKYV